MNGGLAFPCTVYVLYMRKLGKVSVEFLRVIKPNTCNGALESYFVVNRVKENCINCLLFCDVCSCLMF